MSFTLRLLSTLMLSIPWRTFWTLQLREQQVFSRRSRPTHQQSRESLSPHLLRRLSIPSSMQRSTARRTGTPLPGRKRWILLQPTEVVRYVYSLVFRIVLGWHMHPPQDFCRKGCLGLCRERETQLWHCNHQPTVGAGSNRALLELARRHQHFQ